MKWGFVGVKPLDKQANPRDTGCSGRGDLVKAFPRNPPDGEHRTATA